MYRIELAPGEETVYRTIDELATGVRRGFVTSKSRIYHSATQKWLPIEFHPHYKKIIENPDAKTIEVPAPAGAPEVASVFKPQVTVAAEPATVAPLPVAPSPAPARARVAEPLPRAVPSPVLELPKIEYSASSLLQAAPSGAIAPWRRDDDPLAIPGWAGAAEPVVETPVAALVDSTSSQPILIEPLVETSAPSRRPALHLVAAAAGVAVVGYGLLSAFGPMRGSAEPSVPVETSADRPVMPTATVHTAPSPAPAPTVAKAPAATAKRPAIVPTSVTTGFAPALPGQLRDSITSPPAPAAAETPTIAPAPGAVELALPSLKGADSLVALPKAGTDSAAMKRILRAVSGKTPASGR